MPHLAKGAAAMKGIQGHGAHGRRLRADQAAQRHRDVRMPCSRTQTVPQADSGPAYAALDMPVPDTYAVVVRGETHQMD